MVQRVNLKKVFQVYVFLLLGVMPLLVSPWRSEVFYDVKILFVGIITIPFFFVVLFHEKIKITLIDKIIIVMAAAVVLSTVFSLDSRISLFGIPDNREGLISLLLYLMVFFIFYKCFSLSERTMEAVFIIASIVSVFGMLQYYNILPEIISWGGNPTQLNLVTIGNRNFVGTYCTLFLPFTLWRFITKGGKRYFVYSFLIYGLLLSSITRSAWVAFGVYFFIMFWMIFKDKATRNRYIIIAFIFIAMFVVMNITSPIEEVIAERAESIVHDVQHITEEDSGSSRIHIWKNIFPLILHRPLLGGGPDTFKVMYDKFPFRRELVFFKAHNEYLQMAVTLGLPFLIMYLFLALIVLRRIYRSIKEQPWCTALFLAVIGYLVQAIFNVSVISTAPIFWAFLGIGAGFTDRLACNDE